MNLIRFPEGLKDLIDFMQTELVVDQLQSTFFSYILDIVVVYFFYGYKDVKMNR